MSASVLFLLATPFIDVDAAVHRLTNLVAAWIRAGRSATAPIDGSMAEDESADFWAVALRRSIFLSWLRRR